MEEGTLGVWLKDVGDEVKKGDVLAEIESDKVTQELQARHDGILLARIGEPGDALLVAPIWALLVKQARISVRWRLSWRAVHLRRRRQRHLWQMKKRLDRPNLRPFSP